MTPARETSMFLSNAQTEAEKEAAIRRLYNVIKQNLENQVEELPESSIMTLNGLIVRAVSMLNVEDFPTGWTSRKPREEVVNLNEDYQEVTPTTHRPREETWIPNLPNMSIQEIISWYSVNVY